MKRISILSLAILAALLLMGQATIASASHKLPIVTGKHWQSSTQDEKRAFLLGFATAIKLEHEVRGEECKQECKSLVRSWVKGLSPYALTEIIQGLDNWYAENPDELDTPVIKTMWIIYVDPSFAKK